MTIERHLLTFLWVITQFTLTLKIIILACSSLEKAPQKDQYIKVALTLISAMYLFYNQYIDVNLIILLTYPILAVASFLLLTQIMQDSERTLSHIKTLTLIELSITFCLVGSWIFEDIVINSSGDSFLPHLY